MSDYSELKRLAEAATQGKWSVGAFGGVNGHGHTIITNIAMEGCDLIAQITHDGHDAPDFDYIAAARPEVVLALIAESEAIKAQFDECARLFVDATEQACKAQRERDQLKAENEAMRTALTEAKYRIEQGRVWAGTKWQLTGLHPFGQQKALDVIDAAMGKGEKSGA